MARPPATAEQIREFERIVARQPSSRFFVPLAEAYLLQGRTAEAAQIAGRGVAENVGYARGLSVLARALYLDRRIGEALRCYQQACSEHPRESSLRTDWGLMLAAQGARRAARSALEDALRVNPLDAEAQRALDSLAESPLEGDFDNVPTAVAPPRDEPVAIRNLPVQRTKSGAIPALAGPPVPPPPEAPPAPPPRPRIVRAASARTARNARAASAMRPGPKRALFASALMVALAVGFGIWRHVRVRDAERNLDTGLELIARDSAEALSAAQDVLSAAAAARPHEPRLQALLADVAATRWMRFGGGEPARSLAAQASADAARAGARPGQRALAEVLLRLGSGDRAGAAEVASRSVADQPADARVRLAQGLAAAAQGQLDAAEEALTLAVAYDRSWLWPVVELARVERRRGRLEQARATVKEALAREPHHVGARVESLAIEVFAGAWPDPLELAALDQDAASMPAAAAGLCFVRAHLATEHAQPVQARELLERALQLAPADPEYGWTLARAQLLPGGDAARAVLALERLGGPGELALDRADALLRVGRAGAAVGVLEGHSGQRARLLELEALVDLDQGSQVRSRCEGPLDDDRALLCAETAAARGAGREAQRLLLRVARADLRSYAEGLRRLLAGSPADAVELLAGDRALRMRARALAEIGHLEAAEAALAQAAQRSAGAWRDRAAHAAVLAELGETARARGLAETALAARPDAPAALGALAELLAETDAAAQAAEILTAGLAAHPQAPSLWIAQGRLAQSQGDAAGAGRAFAAALAQERALPAAHAGLVSAHLLAGQREQAIAAVKQALATSTEAALEAAFALARGGDLAAADALAQRVAHGLDGPSAVSRQRLARLDLARIGLFGQRPSARRQGGRILAQLCAAPDPPPYALYLRARQVERERGLGSALPLYRQTLERDPGFADAALRLGLALSKGASTQDEGVSYLHRYLHLAATAPGTAAAHKQLARLGR